MTVRTDIYPDAARADVGAPFFSTWRVGTPERQHAVVEAIAKAWESRPWPAEGLLSYSVYEGEDGATLLHYSQWRDEAAYEAYLPVHRDERLADIDEAVPGIERVRLHRTRRYRSMPARAGDARSPGAVVLVQVAFDQPGEETQRGWVDAVFEAMGSDDSPAVGGAESGGISGHFHLSTDGSRVLNYAEWESAQAHIDALASPGAGIGSPTPQWQRVQNYPGMNQEGGSVDRFRLAATFLPG